MRKLRCVIGMIGLLLGACSTQQETQPSAPAQQAYTGPVVEINGVEPRYEPYNPGNMQDYTVNGKRYSIVKNPQNFSQTGLAVCYDSENGGNNTSSGEPFDANALAAAHPTLPLPCYVRVTNLSNGRQLVVRVNDRGPYTPGRIIDLTRAAADRLNISNNTKVKVDVIQVAPDGSLTGPGTVSTVVAKQNFALPPRPDLSSGSSAVKSGAALTPDNGAALSANGGNTGSNGALLTSGTGATAAAQEGEADSAMTGMQQDATPLTSPGQRRGFLGAPSALPVGVVESQPAKPAAAVAPAAAASWCRWAPSATPSVLPAGRRASASASAYRAEWRPTAIYTACSWARSKAVSRRKPWSSGCKAKCNSLPLLPRSSGRNAFLAGAPSPDCAGHLPTCPRPV